MHPWHPRVVSTEDSPLAGEWPVGLWHRLLVDSDVPFGGRVLVVGCRHPEVAATLGACSFDVDVLDDPQSTVEAAGRLFPKFSFTFSHLHDTSPIPAHSFDLVLVHEAATYRRDLLDASVRAATANILACLRPRGQVFFIRRLAGDAEILAGHTIRCWTRHLSCFPGVTETAVIFDSWFARSTWNWMLGRAPRGSHLVVRHELPLELIGRDAWQRCVRRGQISGREGCCAASAERLEAAPLRRAA
jgi:hypothetical protein